MKAPDYERNLHVNTSDKLRIAGSVRERRRGQEMHGEAIVAVLARNRRSANVHRTDRARQWTINERFLRRDELA